MFLQRKPLSPALHQIPLPSSGLCRVGLREELHILHAVTGAPPQQGPHPSITFTMEGNQNETHFLDTIIYRDGHNKLAVKPYIKPTDRNSYLHFGSFHKHQLKTNIP